MNRHWIFAAALLLVLAPLSAAASSHPVGGERSHAASTHSHAPRPHTSAPRPRMSS